MPDAPPTFSESWYRIAAQRISLRPGVRVRRQNYRGERWLVLEDPFSNQFFRLRPAAYEFVARLRPDRTVAEAWQECLDRFPDEAPGQEAVIQLLAQLYFANLLQYDQAVDSAQLFERYKKRRQRETTARLLNIMFLRIPLIDPDAFLVRTLPVVGKILNPFGALLWAVTVGWALKIVADNFDALRVQTQAVLAPDNLFLLYAGLVIVKTLHEFGHAYVCRRLGGEVHTMGVLFMIFTPVPYMDATSSWAFRSRWKRLLVGLAGMIVELFVAAIATFVWANTGPGTLHSLAYNMLFVASVSTVVFNINPLLRFDGYYLLSDLLEIPNLSQRAGQQLRYLAERWLFGLKSVESPATSRSEAGWLVVYGITAGVYRVIVFGGILLLVADRFLILGILMALACFVSWILVPLGKFIHYLSASPKLNRNRPRAVAVSLAMAAAFLVLLAVVPFPSHFRAPGILQARERTLLVTEVDGVVARLWATPGAVVRAGQPLLELRNRELDWDFANAEARFREVQARLRHAMNEAAANLKPLRSRLATARQRLEKLKTDQEALLVRARHDGIWVAPGIQDYLGRRLRRGTPIGLLIEPAAFEFTATVEQWDVDAVFSRPIHGAQVRLLGQAGMVLPVNRWEVIPGGQKRLPSAALGWASGGEVPVNPRDPTQATEPFFEVRADLPPDPGVAFLQGRAGKIRFDLDPEPLLPRWLRRLYQLLQERYQI